MYCNKNVFNDRESVTYFDFSVIKLNNVTSKLSNKYFEQYFLYDCNSHFKHSDET